jgi:hypothetical protein
MKKALEAFLHFGDSMSIDRAELTLTNLLFASWKDNWTLWTETAELFPEYLPRKHRLCC